MGLKEGLALFKELREFDKKVVKTAKIATENARPLIIQKMINDNNIPETTEGLSDSQMGWAKFNLNRGIAKAERVNRAVIYNQNQHLVQEIINKYKE